MTFLYAVQLIRPKHVSKFHQISFNRLLIIMDKIPIVWIQHRVQFIATFFIKKVRVNIDHNALLVLGKIPNETLSLMVIILDWCSDYYWVTQKLPQILYTWVSQKWAHYTLIWTIIYICAYFWLTQYNCKLWNNLGCVKNLIIERSPRSGWLYAKKKIRW